MTIPLHSPTPSSTETPNPGWHHRLPPSWQHAAIRAGVGVALLTAGVLTLVLAAGFPQNAPVEQAINFGLAVDVVAAGLVLLVFAGVAIGSRSLPASTGPVSSLAIAGAVLIVVTVLAFGFTLPGWAEVFSGTRSRFDSLTFGLFLAGMPWGAGVAMSTIALRRPGRASRIVAGAAAAVGVLLAVPAIAATVLYSAGITD